MSEANKDAAQQYLDRAKSCLKKGDVEGAKKAATKSNTLFPSANAVNVLGQADRMASQPRAASAASPAAQATRKRAAARANNETPTDSRKVTPAQNKIVNELLGKRDLYDRLGVARDAEEKQIRRAFLKLSVKVHPDKNPSPKAAEAFKSINNACDVLCDPSKRRVYDQTGEENPNAARQQAQNPFAGFQRGRGGVRVDPAEEMLRNLFGGGFQAPGGAHFTFNGRTMGGNRRRPQQGQGQGQDNENPLNMIFWLLTTMMALSFMWGPDSSSQAVYSMAQTRDFSVPMELANPAEGENAVIKYYIKLDLHRLLQQGHQQRLAVEIRESARENYWKKVIRDCNIRGSSRACIKKEKYRQWKEQRRTQQRQGRRVT